MAGENHRGKANFSGGWRRATTPGHPPYAHRERHQSRPIVDAETFINWLRVGLDRTVAEAEPAMSLPGWSLVGVFQGSRGRTAQENQVSSSVVLRRLANFSLLHMQHQAKN